MLKNLRKTNYNVFEKACKELGIVYTIPPLHIQKNHRRFMTKKALCIQVRVKIAAFVGPTLGLRAEGGVPSD